MSQILQQYRKNFSFTNTKNREIFLVEGGLGISFVQFPPPDFSLLLDFTLEMCFKSGDLAAKLKSSQFQMSGVHFIFKSMFASIFLRVFQVLDNMI